MNKLTVLSLGAGVQSSTLFLMSCRGDIPKLDAAVFADTQWEPAGVYKTVKYLQAEAVKHGIPLHIVNEGRNIREDALSSAIRGTKDQKKRWMSMPLHTLGPDGKGGMLRRQCTLEYKIRPIERFIRYDLLGLKKRARAEPGAVDEWFGISCDESQRIKDSAVQWRRHVYPLCNYPDDFFPRPMTRLACESWLQENYSDHYFMRSACIGCPFKSNRQWRELRDNSQEWEDAVYVDSAIRGSGDDRGKVFLHRSLKPLADVVFDDDQVELWGNECEGGCGT